jgi:hypothetical protein
MASTVVRKPKNSLHEILSKNNIAMLNDKNKSSKRDILYTVARDIHDNLVKASEAEKGQVFYCPICNSTMNLRKSGKIGKNTKRPHFAHQILTPNCTPETALHYIFKNSLFKKLNQHLENNSPLHIDWHCSYCDEIHSGNLLKNIKSVKQEYNLTACKPDIALLTSTDNVFSVIEVVVTHKPEDFTLEYYKNNNIILIQLNLTSDKDIDELDNRIANPDFIGTCFNPKCAKCGSFQRKTKMQIVSGFCHKCKSKMKVAIIDGGMERGGQNVGPDNFNNKELEFARSKGVIIKLQYSKTANSSYLANTCPHCGVLTGNHYLFTDFIVPADQNELESESYDIGFHCDNCIE